MTTENQQQRDITDMVENALMQFNTAIKSQEELNSRMNRRNSITLQFGVLFIIIMVFGVGFFAWSLKNDMNKMNGYMAGMAKDVSVMSHAMTSMQSSMGTMERGINEVVDYTHSISRAIVQTDNSAAIMTHIANSVGQMKNDFSSLNKNVSSVNYNLTAINQQIRNLNKKLGVMGQDVNRMSSPTKMFPF